MLKCISWLKVSRKSVIFMEGIKCKWCEKKEMFKPHRTKQLKKIWKYPKLSTSMSKSDCLQIKSQLNSILKTLTENQLDTLLKSLQNEGGVETDCILINTNNEEYETNFSSDPNYIIAKTFINSKTTTKDLVKKLTCCKHSKNEVCLNPYHSSIALDTEPQLPPYEVLLEIPTANIVEVDKNDSCCSTESSMSDNASFSRQWCRIAYWEHNQRVGRVFDACQETVNVFDNLPQGNGFCLAMLDYGKIARNESSDKVKQTIGYGFQLSRESDGIWLYNRSSIVLFVGSPTIQLEDNELYRPVVKRLPTGCCILVCDSKIFVQREQKQLADEDKCKGQPFCIRISFGKGWGSNYRRLSVTQCPCWIEISLCPT